MTHTLGVTEFARNSALRDKGNSYSSHSWGKVVEIVLENWHKAKPGKGEDSLDRKVLVPVPVDGFFCPLRSKIVMGLPVQAEVSRRQEHEDPFVAKYVLHEDAVAHDSLVEQPAKLVEIVCFSREALSENDEKPSTDCDWEIVTILATPDDTQAPMSPLVMARNYLQKPGGTFTDYTAQAFAESIWHHSTQNTLSVRVSNG